MSRFTRFAKGFQRGKKTGKSKVEQTYDVHLERKKLNGQILDYWYEGLTLKLEKDVRYTPDYLVMTLDGTLECHEVKAGMKQKETGRIVPISEDSSKIKLKVAAGKFPFVFRLAFLHKHEWYFITVGEPEPEEMPLLFDGGGL